MSTGSHSISKHVTGLSIAIWAQQLILNGSIGSGEIVQQLRTYTVPTEGQRLAHISRLTTMCNTSSREAAPSSDIHGDLQSHAYAPPTYFKIYKSSKKRKKTVSLNKEDTLKVRTRNRHNHFISFQTKDTLYKKDQIMALY